MNGIKINYDEIVGNQKDDNVFELRKRIYNNLIDKIIEYIDYLYVELANDQKIADIEKRSIKNNINKESLMMLYKGVEIPIIDKSCIILDNIEYVPIFQMVDKPIHLQKDGKFVVLKNNVRNTFIKLLGHECNIIYKNGYIPLLPHLLYLYKNIREILTDFGYEIIDADINSIDFTNNEYYLVPEYYDNTFLIVRNNFRDNSWRKYFLSPFTIDNFEFHKQICNTIIDQINNSAIPQVINIDENDDNDNEMEDIKEESEIDEILEENKKRRENLETKNIRENILKVQKNTSENFDKLYNIINCYHIATRSSKKSITKASLENALFKYNCEDITLNNISIFSLIIDNVKNDKNMPYSYNITDASQKDIRFMEWYAQKLSAVRSFPEQNLITDIAKIEQKRIYNNSVNPITELAMMCRVNMFGKGALPRESCQSNIRNLNDSYMGIIDPISTPAGANVGISLHLTPEVSSEDLYEESQKLKNNNTIFKLFRLQNEENNNDVE